MFLPSPNEVEFLLWAFERNAAGDVAGDPGWGEFDYAPNHIAQELLHGLRLFGSDGSLRFEAIDHQFRIRAGVERPPWGFREELESDVADEYELPEYSREELEHDDDDDYYGYGDDDDYDRWEEEEPDWHALTLPQPHPYRPALIPGGASEWQGRWYVVWGDWLWEARPDGWLSELAELPDPCELVCRVDSKLILRGARWHAYDLKRHEFVRDDCRIPAFDLEGAYAPRVRHLGSKVWHDTPLSTTATIVDLSPDGSHYRLYDRFGKGGVFETATRKRVGVGGGPFRDERPSREGPGLDGRVMTRDSWMAVLRRSRAERTPRASACVALPSPGSQPDEHVRIRWTDNGLTFFEDDRLLLVLEQLAQAVDFSSDGRFAMVAAGRSMRLIELDERRVVGEWARPARLRFLRSLLPPYEPDEYIEQIVHLWEVLGEPNERSEVCEVPAPSVEVGVVRSQERA